MSPAEAIGVRVAEDATASTYTGAAALAGAAEIARNAVAEITAIPRLALEIFTLFSSLEFS
jgi:hypothetical protein